MPRPSRPFSTDDERSIWEPNTGCLIWLGAFNTQGYGNVRVNGVTMRTHRASYELHNGPIPDGLFVCHTCDNTSCINPEHLYAGTRRQNTDDAVIRLRFRTRKGEASNKAKISDTVAREIFEAKGSQRKLAAKYGICQTAVSYIKRGKRHLAGAAQ